MDTPNIYLGLVLYRSANIQVNLYLTTYIDVVINTVALVGYEKNKELIYLDR